MSWISDFLSNPFKTVFDTIRDVWQTVWNEVINPILEPIANILGWEDQVIEATQVTTQRVFDENIRFTPALLRATIGSTLENTDKVDEFKFALLNNIFVSAKRYFNYGELGNSRVEPADVGDGYFYGSPTVEYTYSGSYSAATTTIIEGLHPGSTVLSFNYKFAADVFEDTADPYKYFSWWYVYNNDATYIHRSNTSSLPTIDVAGTTFTYKHTVVNGLDPSQLDAVFEDLAFNTHIITFTPETNYLTDTFIVDEYSTTTPNPPNPDVVEYHIWLYNYTTNINNYTSLDYEYDVNKTDLTRTLPIICLKADNVWINDDKESQEYKTARVLANYYSLNVDSLIDAIKGTPEGTDNADQGVDGEGKAKTPDAFIVNGVNIYSESQAAAKYLYTFFDLSIDDSNITKAVYDLAIAANETAPYNVIAIKEQNYQQALQYNYIDKETIAGTYPGNQYVGQYKSVVTYVGTKSGKHPADKIELYYQETDSQYIKLTVQGLTTVLSVTTTSGVIKTHALTIHPADNTHPDWDNVYGVAGSSAAAKANFIIPIGYEALNQMPGLSDREALVFESLHFVVHSQQDIELEWYQTPQFVKFVFDVIEIVIYIIMIVEIIQTGQANGSEALKALVKLLLKKILIQLALDYAFKIAIQSTNDKGTQLLLAILYAVASGANWGMDFTSIEFIFKFTNAVGTSYLEQGATELLEDTEDFLKDKKEKDDELKMLNDMLGEESDLALYLSLRKITVNSFYETPDDYYARVLNTNPGILSLNYVENFYDTMISLPRNTFLSDEDDDKTVI